MQMRSSNCSPAFRAQSEFMIDPSTLVAIQVKALYPVALVTGGARRIGASIVCCLHAQGFNVVIHCQRSIEEAKALAAELNQKRQNSVQVLEANLSEMNDFSGLIQRVIGFWGRLDALVNNASTFYPTPVPTVTPAQWDELFACNLKAPFFLIKAAAPYLKDQSGSVINILDIYAERPLKDYPLYSVTKSGLLALTKAMAIELAPDIRVNGVSPGAILWPETDSALSKQNVLSKVALGRLGEVDDIAKTVLFLLSSAPYVTGQVIAVDGGRSLSI